jgi:diaminohydroxyphosphoribosylaminopyrimidine deaminase / 5-amino-6-(5-phosphoribosylamino)uracil reductase
MLTTDEIYMTRCIELAKQGAGSVAPNPMVGAVLVYKEKIIGEGYHQIFGEAHAEVNCINSVKEEDKKFIPHSTLYVSLEPCAHHGKTPPCADLIIKNKIPNVIVGCHDPFNKVNGTGIEKLRTAGVHVTVNILEKECADLNKRFFTFHTKHRPFIILKWAQSSNGKIANEDHSRVFITNEYTNRIVHKWRSEEAAILVGTNTALHDNPELTVRLWKGKSPVRLILDMDLSLPQSLKIFNGDAHTIIFNTIKHEELDDILYYQVTHDVSIVHQVINALYQLQIQSVMIEGGAKLLQSFIDEEMWDEARVITNRELIINDGLAAPELSHFQKDHTENILTDTINFFHHA